MKDPWGKQRIGASATTKLSRKEFGLTWNAALETGGVMVGDEVKINIDVEICPRVASRLGGCVLRRAQKRRKSISCCF